VAEAGLSPPQTCLIRPLVAYPGEAVYEFAQGATWRSGYATVCKTVYTSSILVVASIHPVDFS
jgi:hypothetical protein